MKITAWRISGLFLAVVTVGMILSVPALRADGPDNAAMPALLTPPCSSCDARHAHLRTIPDPVGEARE